MSKREGIVEITYDRSIQKVELFEAFFAGKFNTVMKSVDHFEKRSSKIWWWVINKVSSTTTYFVNNLKLSEKSSFTLLESSSKKVQRRWGTGHHQRRGHGFGSKIH